MVKFVRIAFLNNRWIFAHALGGVYFYLWLHSFGWVFAIAAAWELGEVLWRRKERLIEVYGSISNFVLNSIGDISAALIAAWIAKQIMVYFGS